MDDLEKIIRVKDPNKGIKDTISKYKFPDEVTVLANLYVDEIKNSSNEKNVRAKERDKLIFLCIKMAYAKLNYPVDPYYICNIMKCNYREVIKYNKNYGPSKLNTLPVIDITSRDFIKIYCESLTIQELIEDILEFHDEIVSKNDELLELSPRNVAVGMISKYLSINDYSAISNKDLCKLIDISQATLNNIVNIITKTHNS